MPPSYSVDQKWLLLGHGTSHDYAIRRRDNFLARMPAGDGQDTASVLSQPFRLPDLYLHKTFPVQLMQSPAVMLVLTKSDTTAVSIDGAL